MKLIFAFCVLFNSLIFSQSISDAPEIYMWAINVNESAENTFILQLISTSYCVDRSLYPNVVFFVCDACQPCNDCYGGSETVIGPAGVGSQFGWSICRQTGSLNFASYGWGLYKLYLESDPTRYIYLDLRDANYAPVSGADFRIRYNNDGFGNDYYYFEIDPYANANWSVVPAYTNIWTSRGAAVPSTSPFPDFWENCLAVGQDLDWPRIFWGPHPSFNADGYYIYCATSCRPLSNQEAIASAELIEDINNPNTFTHIDEEFDLSSDCDYVYYYVKAYNSTGTISRTNIVSMKGGIGGIDCPPECPTGFSVNNSAQYSGGFRTFTYNAKSHLQWNSVPDADEYYIYKATNTSYPPEYNSSPTFTTSSTSADPDITDFGDNKKTYFKITAVNTNGESDPA